QRIVAAVRSRHPTVPIIAFPRGAGPRLEAYARATGVQGLGCDTQTSLADMAAIGANTGLVLQGNIDPGLLVAGGDALDGAADRVLEAMRGHAFIANLGHGIRPDTPPENVARLVQRVRQGP